MSDALYASRRHSVQVEALYLLDVRRDNLARYDSSRLTCLILFAVLFGHTTYALQVLDLCRVAEKIAPDDASHMSQLVLGASKVTPLRHLASRIAGRGARALSACTVEVAGR
jgi:hypothetical protein